MDYTVYIIYSAKVDRYYVGSTKDLTDRLRRHQQGRSSATKSGAPHWQLLYTESFPSNAAAPLPEPDSDKCNCSSVQPLCHFFFCFFVILSAAGGVFSTKWHLSRNGMGLEGMPEDRNIGNAVAISLFLFSVFL